MNIYNTEEHHCFSRVTQDSTTHHPEHILLPWSAQTAHICSVTLHRENDFE